MSVIAVYPGTFDPITLGHLDVLHRACQLFDEVIIAIARNPKKTPLFDLDERRRLIEENLENIPNTSVTVFDGLTVEYAKSMGAKAIIRGLRAVSDFEYEFQMAQMNRHLDDQIETIFLMPNQSFFYTSSQLIKAVAEFSAERVDEFVPENVLKALIKRYS